MNTSTLRGLVIGGAALLLGAVPIDAQAPAPAQAPPAAAQPPASAASNQPPAAAAPALPPPVETYTYQPEGRRDPFLNLLGAGFEPHTGRRGDGPGALAVADISVRGVLQSRGSLVAMIAGPDNKTYIVHAGDKLLDGSIKTITPQGLVLIQEVNDPLSLVKQREVSKLLRGAEGVK